MRIENEDILVLRSHLTGCRARCKVLQVVTPDRAFEVDDITDENDVFKTILQVSDTMIIDYVYSETFTLQEVIRNGEKLDVGTLLKGR